MVKYVSISLNLPRELIDQVDSHVGSIWGDSRSGVARSLLVEALEGVARRQRAELVEMYGGDGVAVGEPCVLPECGPVEETEVARRDTPDSAAPVEDSSFTAGVGAVGWGYKAAFEAATAAERRAQRAASFAAWEQDDYPQVRDGMLWMGPRGEAWSLELVRAAVERQLAESQVVGDARTHTPYELARFNREDRPVADAKARLDEEMRRLAEGTAENRNAETIEVVRSAGVGDLGLPPDASEKTFKIFPHPPVDDPAWDTGLEDDPPLITPEIARQAREILGTVDTILAMSDEELMGPEIEEEDQ